MAFLAKIKVWFPVLLLALASAQGGARESRQCRWTK